ncbi:MAG: peroxiredoxin (alkyl hydroperoxide reductase subunit C) [Parcubacteria group bacterium Gr01-1014_44]|nr:MAG: peroxiredoxin (alkyl hydroperoxide reductase subunit C) [Parcubacteria group bacterium Gr01-1014_44]
MININQKITDFEVEAYYKDGIQVVSSADYRGQWLVLFFYPADFTFVCPTELGELADRYEEFQKMGVEVMSVSTDTVYAHKAWHDQSETIKKINFPMLADPTGNLARQFGVYIEKEGLALRGTFIIDPDGVLKAFEVHDNSIGRSVKELMRKIKAAQFVAQHGDQVCPASWEEGEATWTEGESNP